MSKVLINFNRLGWPLRFDEVEAVFQNVNTGNFDQKDGDQEFDVVKYTARQIIELLQIPSEQVTKPMVRRYAMLSTEELYIPVTLARPEKIEQRIVSPLVSAKRLACLGQTEFLASIAMSGLVGEMLAIIIWESHSKERQSKNINEKILFNKGFDDVRQSQRVRTLHAFGYINSEEFGKFRKLASQRNRVLHSFTDEFSNEELESITIVCYSLATTLLKEIFKITVVNGNSLDVDYRIMNYLNKVSPANL